ncbi:MAG TPA: crosslink repair DNA glycosylase YcaQ family protein [Kofleriaceae bacterium]
MSEKFSLAQARAFWWQQQALGTRAARAGSLTQVLGASGWLRTLGGSDVYIAARARHPAMTRADLDAAVLRGELRVSPAARGCIYLVPSAVVPDLMAMNAPDWHKQTEKDLAKVGKTMKLVEKLAPVVLRALDNAKTTDALRKELGADIPSFGDAGKKAGVSSPLPLALRWLELRGEIERMCEGGRLDTQRYTWRPRVTDPCGPAFGPERKVATKLRAASKDPFAAVVHAFLGNAGPATVGQIVCWSVASQREVKAALATLDVASIEIEGMGEAFVLRDQLGAVRAAPPPRGIALLALEDNYLINHGGLGAVSDPRHHAIKVDIWGEGKPEAIGEATHVLSRTIVVDGLIAGFWEVDPRAGGATWMTFEAQPKPIVAEIEERTADVARFLLDDVGSPRAYSLDSIEQVQQRADRVTKLRAGNSKPAKAAAAKPKAKPQQARRARP